METCENCGKPATMRKGTGAGWVPTCDKCKPGDWTGEARALIEQRPDLAGRLLLSKQEAAEWCGFSVDYLEKRVMPDLRTIVRGGRVLIARSELEKWAEKSSGMHLD